MCDINHDYVIILTPFLMLVCSVLQTHMIGVDNIFAGMSEIFKTQNYNLNHLPNNGLKKNQIDFLYK